MKTLAIKSNVLLWLFFFGAAKAFSAPVKKVVSLREQEVTYTANGVTMKGFVVYNESEKGKRPAILVLPEWWGLTDYPKMRARELARLGYIAMAVDLYGNGKVAADPQQAQALAGPFYQKPQMAKERIDAAMKKLAEFPEADLNKVGAIGYCFGGGMALNVANMGENWKGVVSFHGSLGGIQANKDLLKAKLLVCHGGSDPLVSPKDVQQFKHHMDSIGAHYTFKVYPGAKHAFTNPEATALGEKFHMPIAYNEAADKKSWADMKAFFGQVLK